MGQNALFSSKGKGSKGVNNKKSGSRGRNPRRTEKRESRVTPRSFAEKVLRKEKKAKGATTNEKISEEERMLLQYRRYNFFHNLVFAFIHKSLICSQINLCLLDKSMIVDLVLSLNQMSFNFCSFFKSDVIQLCILLINLLNQSLNSVPSIWILSLFLAHINLWSLMWFFPSIR